MKKDEHTYASADGAAKPITLDEVMQACDEIRTATSFGKATLKVMGRTLELLGPVEFKIAPSGPTVADEFAKWRPTFRIRDFTPLADVTPFLPAAALEEMNADADARWFAARHEAGHAVVAWACGFEITRAWAGPGEGAVDFRCAPEDRGGLHSDDLRIRIGAVAVAGAMAQCGRIDGEALPGPGDVDVLEEHCNTPALVKAARKQSASILCQRERAVWAVAERLFAEGALSGDAVVQVIVESGR